MIGYVIIMEGSVRAVASVLIGGPLVRVDVPAGTNDVSAVHLHLRATDVGKKAIVLELKDQDSSNGTLKKWTPAQSLKPSNKTTWGRKLTKWTNVKPSADTFRLGAELELVVTGVALRGAAGQVGRCDFRRVGRGLSAYQYG